MAVKCVKTAEELVASCAAGPLTVVHFAAAWAPQCQQMAEVMEELAKDTPNVQFIQVEAEDLPEVSVRHEVAAVPTFVLFSGGKAVGRVDGAKAAQLTKLVQQHAQTRPPATAPPATTAAAAPAPAASEAELNARLKALVTQAPCMLFMKGTPEQPQCGFSRQMIELFRQHDVVFSSFNILADDAVRQGLKKYSDWPTYPQVYAHGELVGGLDIVKELAASGELSATLPCRRSQAEIDQRLKTLTTAAPVMLFMKGSPDTPRCGFSRKMVDLLRSAGVTFDTFDILSDPEVRQELKRYADFPTYPQLWAHGELVGGLDIATELQASGELSDALKL